MFKRSARWVMLSLSLLALGGGTVALADDVVRGASAGQAISPSSQLVFSQLARGPPVITWEEDPLPTLARGGSVRKILRAQGLVSGGIQGSGY